MATNHLTREGYVVISSNDLTDYEICEIAAQQRAEEIAEEDKMLDGETFCFWYGGYEWEGKVTVDADWEEEWRTVKTTRIEDPD